MIAVDSSGWLEFFTDGPHAGEFAKHLQRPSQVVCSAITVYEVYKWLKRERGEPDAMLAVAAIQRAHVVEVSAEIAFTAGDLSLEYELAMADALILATARKYDAVLHTTDSDFAAVPGTVVLAKRGR